MMLAVLGALCVPFVVVGYWLLAERRRDHEPRAVRLQLPVPPPCGDGLHDAGRDGFCVHCSVDMKYLWPRTPRPAPTSITGPGVPCRR